MCLPLLHLDVLRIHLPLSLLPSPLPLPPVDLKDIHNLKVETVSYLAGSLGVCILSNPERTLCQGGEGVCVPCYIEICNKGQVV